MSQDSGFKEVTHTPIVFKLPLKVNPEDHVDILVFVPVSFCVGMDFPQVVDVAKAMMMGCIIGDGEASTLTYE